MKLFHISNSQSFFLLFRANITKILWNPLVVFHYIKMTCTFCQCLNYLKLRGSWCLFDNLKIWCTYHIRSSEKLNLWVPYKVIHKNYGCSHTQTPTAPEGPDKRSVNSIIVSRQCFVPDILKYTETLLHVYYHVWITTCRCVKAIVVFLFHWSLAIFGYIIYEVLLII